MKKKNILTILMALVAVSAIGVGVYFYFSTTEKPQQSAYTLNDTAFLSSKISQSSKIYETNIDGIYYSLTPTKYYKLENGKFEEIKPKGTFSKKIQISSASLSLKIPYIQLDGKTFGIYEWKKVNSKEGDVYTYALAVITDMPKSLSTSYPTILLIDTNDTGLPATRRSYSEAISVSLSGNIGGYVFDQRNRTVEGTGKLRTDWDLLTLDILSLANGSYVPSLSGRMYSKDEVAQTYDLRLTNSANSKTFTNEVESVWVKTNKQEISCIKQIGDKWSIVQKNVATEKKKTVFTADGNINTDYIIRGDYALNKTDHSVLSLTDGKKITINDDFKSVYDFEVKNGTLVIIGKENNKEGKNYKVQKILIYELSTNKKLVFYANNIMNENSPVFISNGYVFTQYLNDTNAISLSSIAKILAEK